MNKRKLTNEEMDRLGRNLLRATAVSPGEIENIVSSPMLFNSIKGRIEAERPVHEKATLAGFWTRLSLIGWNRAAAAFAIAVIFLAGTVAILVVAKLNRNAPPTNEIVAKSLPVKPAASEPEQKDIPAVTREPSPAQNVTAASYRKEPARAQKAVTHRTSVRNTEAPVFEAEGDFYPVAGTPGGMPQDGHVVRAEIPRSSLVAMGADLPIEGSNEKIKADLLVGSDGVVRGIRIVK